MSKIRMASFSAVVAVGLTLSSCSTAASPQSANPLAGYQHVSSSPSWASWFTKLPELASKSDLVVSGTITKVVGVENIGSDPTSGLLQSTYEFSYNRVLAADRNLFPDDSGAILVTQTGGIDAEHKIVLDVTDDPRFVAGDSAVLFLTKVTKDAYAVQGGPTGRFKLEGGVVSAIVPNGVPIRGITVDQLANQIAK